MRGGTRRFAYRLAGHLGYANVDQMLSEMTYAQLLEWMAYERLEPFEAEKNAYRHAQLVQLIINTYRDRKEHPKMYTLEECMLRFGDDPEPPKPEQDWTEMMTFAREFTELFNAGEKTE